MDKQSRDATQVTSEENEASAQAAAMKAGDNVPQSPMISAPKTAPSWHRHLHHTGIYGFELLMATFGLTTAAIVIDYGLFAFFNYIKGAGSGYNGTLFGEFSLWIVAAMLVWLPLAIVFYMRTRGQLTLTPERRQSTLHKVLVSIYQFVNILLAAGALFTVFYSLIRPLVSGANGEEFGNVLVRVTLPGLLMIAVHGWALMAYSRSQRITHKVFGMVFAGVGLLVMVGLLVVSVGAIRGKAIDDKKERDLSTLSSSVTTYYTSKRTLPKALNDLNVEASKLNLPLDEYSYVRQGLNKYELCTQFNTSTISEASKSSIVDDGYSSYPSFSYHDKGTHCFKIQTRNALCDIDSLSPTAGVSCVREPYDY